jgi:multisubunit Na+/H+ antiporter MnhG subunit
MKLDIRVPLGLLFAVIGLLLAIFGAAGQKDLYTRSLGVNVNLWWGLVLLLFGIFMLLLGRRGQSRAAHSDQLPTTQPLSKGATGHK